MEVVDYMNTFDSFRNAVAQFRQSNGSTERPNICLMHQEIFDQLFGEASALMNMKVDEIPPFFELDGCTIIPTKAFKLKTAMFAHWAPLEIHKRMADLAGELVPLLADLDAIKDGKSVDGGDPLSVKCKAEDVAGKSAERRIGRLVREMRKLL